MFSPVREKNAVAPIFVKSLAVSNILAVPTVAFLKVLYLSASLANLSIALPIPLDTPRVAHAPSFAAPAALPIAPIPRAQPAAGIIRETVEAVLTRFCIHQPQSPSCQLSSGLA